MHPLIVRVPASIVRRDGKVIALFAVLLPALLGVLGLVIDGSMLRVQYRLVQHGADAGATAAAAALSDGKSNSAATTAAVDYVHSCDDLASASITVHIPPTSGPFAGQSGFAQVQVALPVQTYLMKAIGGAGWNTVRAMAVSGSKPATSGAAVVVLDPNPPGIALPAVLGISLPTTPSLSLGGLEVLGVGQLKVNGSVLVNNTWGGVDEHGDPAGEACGFRTGITCMPLVSLTKLQALDIRVTGGVDAPKNYGNFVAGKKSPLRANRKPVPDPCAGLPVPTVAADPAHVSGTLKGGVAVLSLPLIGPPTTLKPGVYEWIQITAGKVIMESGVYIIRNKHPLTGISLQVIGGQVTADGVMFYITDSASFTPAAGLPDASSSGATPSPLALSGVSPSVVLNVGLLGSDFSPLTGTGSVYDGVLLFQNRADRRIIVISRDTLLSTGTLNGTVYAKWGHVIFAGMGSCDTRFVVGSMRFANVGTVTLSPAQLLPAAQDVFLVQ